MAMGIVDTIMAGRLGAAALGAGSLGNMVFYPVAIPVPACCWAWIRWWSQAHGADTCGDGRRSLVNGVWLGCRWITPLMVAVILGLIPGHPRRRRRIRG